MFNVLTAPLAAIPRESATINVPVVLPRFVVAVVPNVMFAVLDAPAVPA